MLDTIKNYIERYKADLKDNNFDAFYSHMQVQTLNPLLTEVFLDLDIDPLDYLTEIPGYYATQNTKIKNLNIPSQIKVIGEDAFSECGNLERVSVPEGVLAIRNNAFYSCIKLEKINVPKSCLFLGSRALQNTAIETIELPSITSIFQSTFNGCTKLKEIEFGDRVDSIDQQAFRRCSSLVEVNLPKNLTILGPYCFEGCQNLQRVIIPKTLSFIDDGIFQNCPNLKEVIYGGSIACWEAMHPDKMFDLELGPTVVCQDGEVKYDPNLKSWEQI